MNRSASTLVAAVDELLPQTQCRRCGYAGCRPYALAMVETGAGIGLCPPGGAATYHALARLLGRAADGPVPADEASLLATIVEADCIGCTQCIQACPVDAIVGAAGVMHTVVAQWCTGCDLCAPVCPTDCIEMRPAPGPDGALARPLPAPWRAGARARFERRSARLAAPPDDRAAPLVDAAAASRAELRDAVLAAVRRHTARRAADTPLIEP